MANDINIQKTVFNSTEFGRIVNRNFTTFTQPIPEEDTDTVDELFRLYEKLYFTIDLIGETNSHQYLIEKSSELVNFERNTEDIQPLLDEISQLREQLLQANQQILELETITV